MKNAKKALLTLAVLSIAACSASAFSACGEHEHEWGEWTVKTEATCETAGKKERVCAGDPSHKEEEAIPALGHNYGAWAEKSPATCTEAKVEEHVCANDATHKETRTVGEALGHTWDKGTVTTQPTEDTPGVRTYKCTVAGCDGSKTEPVPELSHVHTFTGEWQKDGEKHWKVCEGTGCYEIGMSAPHSWNSGTVTKDPTCNAEGVKTYTCGDCGATKTESVAVDATAHSWGEWTSKSAATCSAPAVEERVCAHNPAHKETRNVGEANPEAHGWGDWAEKIPATCTEAKVEERVCAHDVTHKETRTVGSALGHDFSWAVTTKPTDDGTGIATKTCSHSGCVVTEEKTLPSLSSAGVYTVTDNTATCEEKGTANYEYEFEGGKVSFTAETPATGHNWGEWVVSMRDDGGEASKLCQNSGCQEYKHTELPALSEKDQYRYENSATCEMPGNEVYNFVYTDADGSEYIQVKNEEAPAKGHSYGEWKEKTAADCTNAAVEERVCENDNCDASETRTGEAALGHDWSNDPVQAEENNTFTWTCANDCGETDVVEYHPLQNKSTGITSNDIVAGRTEYVYHVSTEEKAYSFALSNINMPNIGVYIFQIRYLDKDACPILINARSGLIGSKKFLSGDAQNGYEITEAFKDNVSAEFDESNRITQVTVKVDGTTIAANSKITFAIQKTIKAGDTSGILLTMKEGNKIYYGENQIKVTEAGATADSSTDNYTFVPTEDATYSMTVPEGVVVLIDGEDLITTKNWANFEVKNGTPVTFTFLASEAGEYTVTIGEEIPNTIIFNEKTSSPVPGNKPATYVVAEDAEEKEYTLVVTPAMAIRQYMYVIINDTKVSFAANGNLVKSDDAENAKYIYLGIGNQTGSNAQEGWSYTCPRLSREFTITLTLKAGDTVSFITSGGGECEFTLIDSAD